MGYDLNRAKHTQISKEGSIKLEKKKETTLSLSTPVQHYTTIDLNPFVT